MQEKTSFVLLWLEGNFQSWGVESKFGRRLTLDFPTQSGLAGLVLCAMGKGGEQVDFLKKISSFHHATFAFLNQTEAYYHLLEDFHMVGSGFSEKDPFDKKRKPTSPNKSNLSSKMTYRMYLQNAKFAVFLKIPQTLLSEIKTAFQWPIWDLYLGRKSCIPSEFLWQGSFETFEAASKKATTFSEAKNLKKIFSVFSNQLPKDYNRNIRIERHQLNDVPLKFGAQKMYRDREVFVIYERATDVSKEPLS
jgi:CRISPR system Cascade subunit CasD